MVHMLSRIEGAVSHLLWSPSVPYRHRPPQVDAIGTKRYDSHSGGEREIQRTMLELLNQLDGFDERGEVKVRRLDLGVHWICRCRH